MQLHKGLDIYEGTNGLRGLVAKLIEIGDFKKVLYEGESNTFDTQNVVFQLWVTDQLFIRGQFSDTEKHGWVDICCNTVKTDLSSIDVGITWNDNIMFCCPSVVIFSNPDSRRWVIYKQNDLIAFGIQSDNTTTPPIYVVVGQVIDYITQETDIGLVTSFASNDSNKFCMIDKNTEFATHTYRYCNRQSSITTFSPVVAVNTTFGFTNLYHVHSHIIGEDNASTSTNPYLPTRQIVTINNEDYLVDRFAFKIAEE